jgi:hypothetical protein
VALSTITRVAQDADAESTDDDAAVGVDKPIFRHALDVSSGRC